MNKRKLGRTGFQTSEIGFGCWAIGGSAYGPTNDEDSLAALEQAYEHGVNFFDTADTYGEGHSEELVARFLKNKPNHQVFVATKVGWDFYEKPSRKKFDVEYIRFACEQSLRRLGVETIDLYQLHNPTYEQLREGDVLATLEKLKQEGKIRFAGVSVHKEMEALAAIEDDRVDAVQLILNMLDQRMAGHVLERAQKREVAVIVREPLACGLLTGKYSADVEFPKGDHRRRWSQEKKQFDFEKIELMKALFAQNGLLLAQAALEFVLGFSEVSVVIPGAKTKEQVLQNLLATESPKLGAEEKEKMRELFLNNEIFMKGLNPA